MEFNTPNLLSNETKTKLKENKKKKIFLYPWHFFPEHWTRGNDVVWKLIFNKKEKNKKFYDLERRAYNFPPPRNAPQQFIRQEHFLASYVRPQD